jgi:hypothetical protein
MAGVSSGVQKQNERLVFFWRFAYERLLYAQR